MPQIASFVVGFLLAQATWWFAARTSGGTDEYALGGAPTFRFLMLAGAEVLIAAIVFGAVMAVVSRARNVPSSTKSNFVSLVAGATTATIAAGPYALIPRIVEGELMLLIYILAAAVVSAAFGALVAMAFRGEPITEAQAIADNS
jgi:hypothetical protein